MSERVYKKPDGSFVKVDDQYAEAAKAKGYVESSPEAAAASKQTGQAGLEGVARGATLGFGDQLIADFENALGPVQTGGIAGLEAQRAKTLEEMRLRKEENPVAAFTGELGGNIALSAVTGGGPSALLGGGAKGLLFEGGLAGLGAVVSESTLDKSPLTMEKMAAGMAGGALAVGGIAGVMKGTGALVSAGVRKLGGSTIAQTLRQAADEAETKAIFGGNVALLRKNKELVPDVLKIGRENGIIHAGAALDGETAAKADDLARSYIDKIDGEMKTLESFVPLTKNDDLRQRFASSLRSSLTKQFEGRPTFENALKDANSIIDKIEKNRDLDWSAAWRIQSDLYKDLAGKEAPPAASEVREALRQAMRDFVFDEVASGKDQSAKILTAAKGFEPKIKVKLGEAFTTAVPEAPAAPGSVPRDIAQPVTINLDSGGSAGGMFDAPVTFAGGAVDNAAANPKLKVWQGDKPGLVSKTVPLGEPGTLPGGVFTDETGAKFTSAAERNPRVEIPKPVFQSRTINLDEAPKVGGLHITPDPITVNLDAPELSGGMLIDVPEQRTPAWFGAQLRQTGREAKAAMVLAKALKNRATSLEAAAGSNSTTLGTIASLASGNPLPIVGALAGDALKDNVKKRGGFVLGSVLRKLGDSQAIESIANGLQQRVGQVLSTAPGMLGGARIPLEAAFARGSMALLEEYTRIAHTPDGPAVMASLGMQQESPDELEAVGGRLAAMDALHAAQKDIDHRIDLGISSVLGNKTGPMPKFKSPDTSGFKARVEQMKQTLTDPQKAFETVPNELLTGAPSTTAELVNKLLTANQFLLSKAPQDPFEGMPKALKPTWEPSAADISKFYRYVEAVEQPAKMLEKMAHGAFTLEHRDALQAVYPALYEDIKARMYDRLAEWEKPLPYGKKAMLSQFFGTSVLGLKPGSLNIIQQSFEPDSGQDSPSQGGSRPDGREVLDADKNALTQAQRIEAKGATPA